MVERSYGHSLGVTQEHRKKIKHSWFRLKIQFISYVLALVAKINIIPFHLSHYFSNLV